MLTAAHGFVIQGDASGDLAGFSVGATGGDNGGYNAGEAYVIHGQAGATRGRLDLSGLTSSQGFVIQAMRRMTGQGSASPRPGMSTATASTI